MLLNMYHPPAEGSVVMIDLEMDEKLFPPSGLDDTEHLQSPQLLWHQIIPQGFQTSVG
jgi:hypothetical protein